MSNVKVITINSKIHQLLLEKRGTFISIKEIKERFIAATDIQISSDEVARVIYRQLVRLLKHQVIEKKLIDQSKYLGYQVTKNFDQVEFRFKKFKIELEASRPKEKVEQLNRSASVITTLNNQLTQYEVDFQSSIAESEEYKRLFTIAPEMKDVLEAHFLNARNISNQLLGKITAVKNIIGKLDSGSSL